MVSGEVAVVNRDDKINRRFCLFAETLKLGQSLEKDGKGVNLNQKEGYTVHIETQNSSYEATKKDGKIELFKRGEDNNGKPIWNHVGSYNLALKVIVGENPTFYGPPRDGRMPTFTLSEVISITVPQGDK